VSLDELEARGLQLDVDVARPDLDRSTLVADCKYAGYLRRLSGQLHRLKAQESVAIPETFEYEGIAGLSHEVVERLASTRPSTLGQAARVPGVTPAAVAIVAARLARGRGLSRPVPPPA
jgi:tRNA uridine 5-carboxymethylaminomethyl modification enzyme